MESKSNCMLFLFLFVVLCAVFFVCVAIPVKASISYISAPYSISSDNDFTAEIVTTSEEDLTINLKYQGTTIATNTALSNTSVNTTFTSGNFTLLGNYSILVYSSTSGDVLEYYFIVRNNYRLIISPLETNNQTATKFLTVNLTSPKSNPGLINDENISKSGIIFYGNTTESAFGCDLDKNESNNQVMHIWVSDPDEAGVYNTIFIDDDSNLVESTETGKLPKLFLKENDLVFQCKEAKYNNQSDEGNMLGPYTLAYIYKHGVSFALAPGPGDTPYSQGDSLDFIVIGVNSTGEPYKNLDLSTVLNQKTETGFDTIAISPTTTGATGFSSITTLNLSTYPITKYAIMVNNIASYTFEIAPSWDAKIIIGEPLKGNDEYYFELNKNLDVGVVTDAESPSIFIDVINPDGNVVQSWYYVDDSNKNEINYDSDNQMYLAGNSSFALDQTGKWAINVRVKKGDTELLFRKDFIVKPYELMVMPVSMKPNKEPDFGQYEPGSNNAYIGAFALKFGTKGNIQNNIEEADFIDIDTNTSDSTNECNAAILSVAVKDSDGNAILSKANFTINNMYNMTSGIQGLFIPSQFNKQCMLKFKNGAPSDSGEYSVTITLNTSQGLVTREEYFLVRDIFTFAQGWNTNSNSPQWQFSPGGNVTLKINSVNLYNGEEISSSSIKDISLLNVFNQDLGDVTDLIDTWSFDTSNSILAIQLPSETSGFYHVEYRLKAEINKSGTISNGTSIGFADFETRLYNIWGHPNWDLKTQYFKPGESINFTVEVFSPSGPVSSVDVYVLEIFKDGKSKEEGLNFTASRGTTDENGRADITISPQSGTWEVGDYNVRIKVKDANDVVDYGYGWFEVKSFQTMIVPVTVTNGTCEEIQFNGDPSFNSDPTFVVAGVTDSGIVNVEPKEDESTLTQYTNLNGDPMFKKLTGRVINNNLTCNLNSYFGEGEYRYVTINTSGGLGGEFDLELVVSTDDEKQSSGKMHFLLMPFDTSIDLYGKKEPFFAKGETIFYKIETDENISNISVQNVMDTFIGRRVEGAAQTMDISLSNKTCSSSSSPCMINMTLPDDSSMEKGEFIIQIKFTFESGDSLVYNQYVQVKPFIYSMAKLVRSSANDANKEDRIQLSFWDQGNVKYETQGPNGPCPFPVVSGDEPCGFINMTTMKNRILNLWGEQDISNYAKFTQYYNETTHFQGLYMVVGSLDTTKIAQAKVYASTNLNDLYNDSLDGYSVGDVITDASGAKFEISEIKQNEIYLKPVTFATSWEVKEAIVNVSESQTGNVKLGIIKENEVESDFNNDGNENDENYGIVYALFDKETANRYNFIRADKNMNLNLMDENEFNTSDPQPIILTAGGEIKDYYLIKADRFDTFFALAEEGFDNWFGTHRVNEEIIVPIYSSTIGLNISVFEIINDRTNQALSPSNYNYTNATVGSNGLGFLRVTINTSGFFRILYKITFGNITEIPEPWKTPFIEVRSFDTDNQIVTKVTIPAPSVVDSVSSKTTGFDQRGYIMDRASLNATQVSMLISTLPSNFNGFGGFDSSLRIPSEGGINILLNKSSGTIYINNTMNFSQVAGHPLNQVAYTIYKEYPADHYDDYNNSAQNITLSLAGKQCYGDDGCNIAVRQTKSEFNTPIMGIATRDGEVYTFSIFDHDFLRNIVVISQINNLTNESRVMIYRYLNESQGNLTSMNDLDINIDVNGTPSNTSSVPISGKLQQDNWCMSFPTGCFAGDYSAFIQLINVTYDPNWPNGGAYYVNFRFNESYSERSWVNLALRTGGGDLILPGNGEYLITDLGSKGVWVLINMTDPTNPSLFIRNNKNFSGAIGYKTGQEIPTYEREINKTINYMVKYLSKDFGEQSLTVGSSMAVGRAIVSVDGIDAEHNRTIFSINDPQGCSGTNILMDLGVERQMCDFLVTVSAIEPELNKTNFTLFDTGGIFELGFNTTEGSEIYSILYNENLQKRVTSIIVNGTEYTILYLDMGGVENGRGNFTKIVKSADTTLTDNEIFNVTNTNAPFIGNYYLVGMEDWYITLFKNYNLKNVPYSWDNAGYRISRFIGAANNSPFINTSLNYTMLIYDDNDNNILELKRIVLDDDSDFYEDTEDNSNIIDEYGAEGGTLAESWGQISTDGGGFNVKYANGSEANYQIWDQNISEEIRLIGWVDSWQGVSPEQNLTIGLRIRDFDGNPLSGNVNITQIIQQGFIPPDGWVEGPFNTSLYQTNGQQSFDSDGIAFLEIKLVNGGQWLQGFGFSPKILINAGGASETTDIWFSIGGGDKK